MAMALAALFGAVIYAAHADILFTRHFWLDEYLTSLIVRDPSVTHAIAAVRGGVDTNPPVYHLLLRAFYAIVGGRPEVTFRAFAVLCTGVALVATYALLRRSFAVAPAVLAVLALAGHRLVLKESFEARFYAPLLAATACFALVFCQGGTRQVRGWGRDVLVALAAALVCTLHYFGVIALASVVAGEWLISGSSRAFLRRLLPVAAGPVALLATVPFLLGQRQGLTVPTWMPAVTTDGIVTFIESVFYALPLVVVLLAWCASQFFRRDGAPTNAPPPPPSPRLAPVAGLAALAAVPLVVLVFSLLAQPSLAPKYAIPAVLALAPITAALAAPLRPAAAGAVGVVLALLLFFNVSSLTDASYNRHELARQRAQLVRSAGHARPVVTTSRDGAYMLHHVAPDLAARVKLLDIRPFNHTPDDRLYRYEMDMAAKVRRFYPVVPVIDVAALRALGPFHFEGSSEELAWLSQRVPLRPAGPGLWEVQ
jgi:uncharacterized membrane protein